MSSYIFTPPRDYFYFPDGEIVKVGGSLTRTKPRLRFIPTGRIFILPRVIVNQSSGWTASVNGRIRIRGSSIIYTHFLNWSSFGFRIRLGGACLLEASAYIAILPRGRIRLLSRASYFWDMLISYTYYAGHPLLPATFRFMGSALEIVSSGYACVASGRLRFGLWRFTSYSYTGINFEFVPIEGRLRFGTRTRYFYRWVNHYYYIGFGSIPLLGTFGIWTNHYDIFGNGLINVIGDISVDFVDHWWMLGVGGLIFGGAGICALKLAWLGLINLVWSVVGLFGLHLNWLAIGKLELHGIALTKLHLGFLTYALIIISGYLSNSGSLWDFECAYGDCYSDIAAVGFFGDYNNIVLINKCLTVRFNLTQTAIVNN